MSTYYSYYLFQKTTEGNFRYLGPYKKDNEGKISIVPFLQYSRGFDYGFFDTLDTVGSLSYKEIYEKGMHELFFSEEYEPDPFFDNSTFAYIVPYRSLAVSDKKQSRLVYISSKLKRGFELYEWDKDPEFMEYNLDYDDILTISEFERLSDKEKKNWFPYIMDSPFTADNHKQTLLTQTDLWLDNACLFLRDEEEGRLYYFVTVS